MKNVRWQFVLGAGLVLLSAALYLLQIEFFHHSRDTLFYFIQDIAFIPIQILVVTLIIDQVLSGREKQSLLKKMNMVIGAFYSEVGSELIRKFADFELNVCEIRQKLMVGDNWTEKEFSRLQKTVKALDYQIDARKGDLSKLKEFLVQKKAFFLRLLENPNLLEHDTFTDLLWAVFHLTEELEFRRDLGNLSEQDAAHLSGDMKRVFALLGFEWLSYMKHLKKEYPYLYSLFVRMNPFDSSACAEIK